MSTFGDLRSVMNGDKDRSKILETLSTYEDDPGYAISYITDHQGYCPVSDWNYYGYEDYYTAPNNTYWADSSCIVFHDAKPDHFMSAYVSINRSYVKLGSWEKFEKELMVETIRLKEEVYSQIPRVEGDEYDRFYKILSRMMRSIRRCGIASAGDEELVRDRLYDMGLQVLLNSTAFGTASQYARFKNPGASVAERKSIQYEMDANILKRYAQ